MELWCSNPFDTKITMVVLPPSAILIIFASFLFSGIPQHSRARKPTRQPSKIEETRRVGEPSKPPRTHSRILARRLVSCKIMASMVKPEWLSEIKEFLKCVSCRQTILDPPVRECRVGHLLCGKCFECPRQQLQYIYCPVCPSRTKTHINHLAVNILTKLPKKKCMFRLCAFSRTDVRSVADHELFCTHRTVLCYTCFEYVPMSRMSAHLATSDHSSSVWKTQFGKPFRLLSQKITMQGRIFSDALEISELGIKSTFFLHRVNEGGRYLFWITHTLAAHESTDRAFQYTVSVSTLDARGNRSMLVQHTGFCTSHDAHPTTMKNTMFCLVVPQDVLENVLDKKGRFGLKAMICKV